MMSGDHSQSHTPDFVLLHWVVPHERKDRVFRAKCRLPFQTFQTALLQLPVMKSQIAVTASYINIIINIIKLSFHPTLDV